LIRLQERVADSPASDSNIGTTLGGYTIDLRVRAENAVSRIKALVGVKLAARAFETQQVEALVKCRVLNRMAALGMPVSERVLRG